MSEVMNVGVMNVGQSEFSSISIILLTSSSSQGPPDDPDRVHRACRLSPPSYPRPWRRRILSRIGHNMNSHVSRIDLNCRGKDGMNARLTKVSFFVGHEY